MRQTGRQTDKYIQIETGRKRDCKRVRDSARARISKRERK